MNKAALKSFAIEARNELIDKVKLRAKRFGMDAKTNVHFQQTRDKLEVNGTQCPLSMSRAFESLQQQYVQKGFTQLIEEAAYTWFNRIIAIRYMEVHEYLPDRVNVLSSSSGRVEPDILLEYASMDLSIEPNEIRELAYQDPEQAYRKLFIAQCNALKKVLPFLFETIDDYTELLLPDFLLDPESVIRKLVGNDDLTESFADVEVIGWLYQFYNSEPKDEVFANLKKNKKIGKYDIPPATQLFTPKWIVKYMVENSLGQLWLDHHPDSSVKQEMKYYIEPAEQEDRVKQRLEELRHEVLSLEELKFLDPCCGSGHVLVYAFDLLYKMYEEAGYPKSDIPVFILEKNLYGIDIDDRAAQLACFALMMKARETSRTIFRKNVLPNILACKETNQISANAMAEIIFPEQIDLRGELIALLDTYKDAKNYGALLMPETVDTAKILARIEELQTKDEYDALSFSAFQSLGDLKRVIKQHAFLKQKYDVVVTNPPYMGAKGMNPDLLEFMKEIYPKSKSDLSTAFMERCLAFSETGGFTAMINIPSWMFLSSYEKLRELIINQKTIQNLVHLGRGIFGSDFGTVAFVLRNIHVDSYIATYKRLIDKQGEVDSNKEKEMKFFQDHRNFQADQNMYLNIPGMPIAFWASNKVRQIFKENPKLGDIAEPRVGMTTANNDKFLRLWFEPSFDKIGFDLCNSEKAQISNKKWFPYNKGGDFRKWYGNQEYVVNWENNGIEIKNSGVASVRSSQYYFQESITWSFVSSAYFGVRYSPKGFLFDSGGSCVFPEHNQVEYLTALLCSKLAHNFLSILNPTQNFQVGNVGALPIKFGHKEEIEQLGRECIQVSRKDWDSFETSWNFKKHPFIKLKNSESFLRMVYLHWEEFCRERFLQLQSNEMEINRLFIGLYELQDEITAEVSSKEVTLRVASRNEDTKSFLSYFIGCLTGRYSLDIEGLAYASGEWDESKYERFKPLQHGIILFTDATYFDDDIISRLRDFLSVIYGNETVEENLEWIADSLERKKNESAEARIRRFFMDEFFKGHTQVYQKRPIYWLVDSGKQAGLRSLIYMHRYQHDTMAAIRFKHLKEIQAKYYNEIEAINIRLANPELAAKDKRDLEKEREKFNKRIEELTEFDKKLATYANDPIDIDLDDGVKVNYAKFTDNDHPILAKI